MAKKKRPSLMDAAIQIFPVPTHWVSEGELRLNASFYCQNVIAARLLLEKVSQRTEIVKLADLVGVENIFMPALKITIPFSCYGKPYLTQSEVDFFLPKARKTVDIARLSEPSKWRVKNGYLLISQSGTIGRVTIATEYLERFIISPNPIRVVSDEKTRGYLYAFLSTWIGSAFIKSPQYGVTVDHILPHHLYDIPIPRMPGLEEDINQKILKAHRLRKEAQELILKAEEILYSNLALPKIDEDDVQYFGGERGQVIKSFEIKACELNLRLDASHHIPLAHLAIENLRQVKSGSLKRLEEVAGSFVPPRFKRAYVKDPADGIPLLQGTHMPQMKPRDIKYIWKKMKNLNSYIVRKNWILVTCSGTIGRMTQVRNGWNGWAATNHLLRIVPNENKIHAGYLTAFLLSVYGQVQFRRLIYGGVVDEIGESGELFNDVLILQPKDKNIENEIGNLTFEGYDKRDKANLIEAEAIRELERRLKEVAG